MDDPLSILTHMRDGTVSEEEVALPACSRSTPTFGRASRRELAKGAAQQKLDRTQRLALSTVFGIPADRNMKPEIPHGAPDGARRASGGPRGRRREEPWTDEDARAKVQERSTESQKER